MDFTNFSDIAKVVQATMTLLKIEKLFIKVNKIDVKSLK